MLFKGISYLFSNPIYFIFYIKKLLNVIGLYSQNKVFKIEYNSLDLKKTFLLGLCGLIVTMNTYNLKNIFIIFSMLFI